MVGESAVRIQKGKNMNTYASIRSGLLLLLATAWLADSSISVAQQRPMATAIPSGTTHAKVPNDFLGLSWEWGSIQKALGQDPANSAALNLIKNLTSHGAALQIRVGGNTTDLSSNVQDIEPLVKLASEANVRFTLGVNLKTAGPNSRQAQASAYARGIPNGKLDSLEIGNEPNGYPGASSESSFDSQYLQVMKATRDLSPKLDFSGPSCSIFVGEHFLCDGPQFQSSGFNLDHFIQTTKPLGLLTLTAHYYYAEGGKCAVDCLLQPEAYTGAHAAPVLMGPLETLAHRNGIKFRINEFNSLWKGGQHGVSDSFQSALWFIGTAMSLASQGVDGINVHGNYLAGGSYYDPFFILPSGSSNKPNTLERAAPLYYGMLFFSVATQNNVVLRPMSLKSAVACTTQTAWTGCLQAWQTVDSSNVERDVILNLDLKNFGNIAIPNAAHVASVCYLDAPSYDAQSNVSFSGQTLDNSPDGTLRGQLQSKTVMPTNGVFYIPMKPTEGAIVRFGSTGGC